MLASLFILSGFSKIGASEATQGYIASVGMPAPMLAYLAAIVVELGGGILLVVGYRARVVSLLLAAFTVVAVYAGPMLRQFTTSMTFESVVLPLL